ncbi:MAG TPA: YncE family protein [Mycobacterium sp.]|uniref:YncE family protein n=1 Tax=Mycobacterium sp. TaxID=1785 RepID=UPI002F3E519B
MSDVIPGLDRPPGFAVADEIAAKHGAVSGMAISPDGAMLTLTHYGDDSFSLIDTRSGAVALTVVDVDESSAVAMSGSRAYVSTVAAEHDSVLAFDTDSNEIAAEYPLAFSVTDLAVSPNGRQVYAGRTGVNGADVAIIDTKTGKGDSVSIASTAGATAGCVRVSPDGRRLYVAVNGAFTAELVVIDAVQKRVLSTIEIGSPIRDIALSPNGATAYVGSCGPDFGTVLDVVDVPATRMSINATYKFGDVAGALAQLTVSRDGERTYLVGDQSVTVLSTATQDVIGNIVIDGQPSCAIESPDGKRLYIADYAGTVTVMEIAATAPRADARSIDDDPTAPHLWAVPDLLLLQPTPA